MTHLTRDEQLQAVEGVLVARRHRHVVSCPACRAEIEALRAVLHAVRDTPVPEPSPLFWEHFSARVREAVAREPSPREPSWWMAGWRPLVASVSAVALVGIVLGALWGSNRVTSDDRVGPATTAASASVTSDDTGSLADDEEWGFVLAVADDSVWTDDDGLAWSSRPGQAELTLPDLTNEEQAALVALLHDAVATPSPRASNRPG